MKGLTAKQKIVLQFIADQIENRGIPPSRAEMARHFEWKSPNASDQVIKAIEKKGFLECIPNTARGIRILRLPK